MIFNDFTTTFSAVLVAQLVGLFIGWLFRIFIEPRLNKTHGWVQKMNCRINHWWDHHRKKLMR